jgi:hypothetical protein
MRSKQHFEAGMAVLLTLRAAARAMRHAWQHVDEQQWRAGLLANGLRCQQMALSIHDR